MHNGLGIDSTLEAIIVLSWYDILWSNFVVECESCIVPFITSQQVAGNDKGTLKQFMASMTIICILISIRTYLDDFESWYKMTCFDWFWW